MKATVGLGLNLYWWLERGDLLTSYLSFMLALSKKNLTLRRLYS